MSQGYIPPKQQQDQRPGRSRRQQKRKSPRIGWQKLKTALIIAFVIGIVGVFAVDEWAGKVFFAAVAIVSGYFYWKRYIAKPVQEEPAQPLQPFQPESSTASTEFINASGHRQGSLYEFVDTTVAGVTFSNGRRQRQTILRQIYWKDEPYHRDIEVNLRVSAFEGQPAVEVWVNEEQIGYVPKDQAAFYAQNMYRFDSVFDFEVCGGGSRNGEQVSYGASFTTRFRG